MKNGYKHLVECNCILPQFRDRRPVVFHKFVVFSEFDDNDNVIPKVVLCNNCSALHRVTGVCTSEIVIGRDSSAAVLTIEDIKSSLSREIAEVLTKNDCDLATWEHAQFIVENKLWGEHVIISKDVVDDARSGKVMRILGESIFKIVTFSVS